MHFVTRSQETYLRLGLIHFAEGGMSRKISRAWPSSQAFFIAILAEFRIAILLRKLAETGGPWMVTAQSELICSNQTPLFTEQVTRLDAWVN